ncbi:MAG: FAD-dependent oxidoreductase, partial [bacterium]
MSTLTATQNYTADIVIYGGTSGAITAAIQAKKMGRTVIVVSPDKHLG